MSRASRGTGVRNRRGPRRTRVLKIALTEEEYALIFETAKAGDEWAAVWARDHLLSRALRLHKQRHLT